MSQSRKVPYSVLALLCSAGTLPAFASSFQMDFNVDGQLPHQENTNLTQTNDGAGAQNGNYDEVIGNSGMATSERVNKMPQSQRPRLRYYSGNNPSVLAPAGTPLSINVRMRLLAPATAQLANMNSDRDFYIDFRNGSGLMLMEFLYSGDTSENKIGGIQANGSLGLIDTGSTFADFHTYTYVWDSLFDGTGTGEVGVVDVYMDGAFIGVTKAYNGGANSNGYTLFGDGASPERHRVAGGLDSLRHRSGRRVAKMECERQQPLVRCRELDRWLRKLIVH